MGKLTGLIAKLKNLKNKEIILGGVALILILAVYFSFASCAVEKTGSTSGTGIDLSKTDYCTAMQIQVENIVSEISGVGEARVVINWDKSVGTSSFGMSGESQNPKALGALIVCDGGNQTKVKLDVIYAVSTLLDLSIEKIIVYPKSNK